MEKPTRSVVLRTLGLHRQWRHGLEAICSDARRINCATRWTIPISTAIELVGAGASPEQVFRLARCPACRSAPRWMDTVIEAKPAGTKPVWGFGQWDRD